MQSTLLEPPALAFQMCGELRPGPAPASWLPAHPLSPPRAALPGAPGRHAMRSPPPASQPAGLPATIPQLPANMGPASKEEEEEEVIYCLDQTQEERRSYEGWDGGGRRAAVRGGLGGVRGGGGAPGSP